MNGSEQLKTLAFVEANGFEHGTPMPTQSEGDVGEPISDSDGAGAGSGDSPLAVDARSVHQALLAVGVAIDAALMGSLVTLLECREKQDGQDPDPNDDRVRCWYNAAMEAQRRRLAADATRSVTAEQWKQSFLRAATDGKGILGAVNAEEFVAAVRFSVTTQSKKSKFSTKPLPPWPQTESTQKSPKSQTRTPVVHSSTVLQLFAYLDQARSGKVKVVDCVRFFAGRGSVRVPSAEKTTELFDRCWLLLSEQQQMLDVQSVSRNLFSAVDPSYSGYINESQLQTALKKRQILLNKQELKMLATVLDKDGDGQNISTEAFQRNLREAKRRSDRSRSGNRQFRPGRRLPSARAHEQVPPVKRPPFAEWEAAATHRLAPNGDSFRTASAKTDIDSECESPIPLIASPRRDLDDRYATVDDSTNRLETIETFSHRAKAPPLWSAAGLRLDLHGGAVPVSFQSREHAMAGALRQALRDAMRRKRKVCGEILETPIDIFRVFDRDGSGKLSSDELKQALTKLGLGYTPQQLHMLSEFLDTNGDGEIDYQELVAFLQDTFGPIAETESNGQLPVRMASRRRRELQEKKAFQETVAALDEADEKMEAEMEAKMVNGAGQVTALPRESVLTTCGEKEHGQESRRTLTVEREVRLDTRVSGDGDLLADSGHVENGPLLQRCEQEDQPLQPQQLPTQQQQRQQQQQPPQQSREAMLAKRKAYLRRMQERKRQHA